MSMSLPVKLPTRTCSRTCPACASHPATWARRSLADQPSRKDPGRSACSGLRDARRAWNSPQLRRSSSTSARMSVPTPSTVTRCPLLLWNPGRADDAEHGPEGVDDPCDTPLGTLERREEDAA